MEKTAEEYLENQLDKFETRAKALTELVKSKDFREDELSRDIVLSQFTLVINTLQQLRVEYVRAYYEQHSEDQEGTNENTQL